MNRAGDNPATAASGFAFHSGRPVRNTFSPMAIDSNPGAETARATEECVWRVDEESGCKVRTGYGADACALPLACRAPFSRRRPQQGYCAFRRIYLEARAIDCGHSQARRLPLPATSHSRSRGAGTWQRIRQQRPVQPHIFHHRQSDQISPLSRRAGLVAPRNCGELHLFHRRVLRPVPLRHVRIRVPAGARKRRVFGIPPGAIPSRAGDQGGRGEHRACSSPSISTLAH